MVLDTFLPPNQNDDYYDYDSWHGLSRIVFRKFYGQLFANGLKNICCEFLPERD